MQPHTLVRPGKFCLEVECISIPEPVVQVFSPLWVPRRDGYALGTPGLVAATATGRGDGGRRGGLDSAWAGQAVAAGAGRAGQRLKVGKGEVLVVGVGRLLTLAEAGWLGRQLKVLVGWRHPLFLAAVIDGFCFCPMCGFITPRSCFSRIEEVF